MKPPRNSWPKTPNSNAVLMFAQLMREMLSPQTFESFKVYSLDTISRLQETYDITVDVISSSNISRDALDPILRELTMSMEKDPVCRRDYRYHISTLKTEFLGKRFDPRYLRDTIQVIKRDVAANYKTAIETDIVRSFFEADAPAHGRRACVGFYCSFLINSGYSHELVAHAVDEHFFSRPMKRCGPQTLSSFFKRFDMRPGKFRVTVAINDHLSQYLREMEYQTSAKTSVSGSVAHSLEENANSADLNWIVEILARSLDPFGAQRLAIQELGTHRAIAFLQSSAPDFDWGEIVHVSKVGASVGQPIKPRRLLLPRGPNAGAAKPERARRLRNVYRVLHSEFDESSIERVTSALNTAALARTSDNKENQLISLWSALEVLLSEPRETARIVHYADLFTPVICYRHVRNQFVYLSNSLTLSYKRKYTDLLIPVSDESSALNGRKLAQLIALEEWGDNFEKLLRTCRDNPLATYRILRAREEYSTSGNVKRALIAHRDRVSWQIHRIYRARNGLVHAGRVPSFIDSLIVNAAEYFRSSIVSILSMAMKEFDLSNIDENVTELKLKYRGVLDHFDNKTKDEKLNAEDMDLLLCGS